MPSNGYPFEYVGGIGVRGAMKDTAFILITRRGKWWRQRIYCFGGWKRNFLSSAPAFQNSITLFEGSQPSHLYPSDNGGALQCRFVQNKLTQIGSGSKKVFRGQKPPQPRHDLSDRWRLPTLHRINSAPTSQRTVTFRRITAVYSENHREHITYYTVSTKYS